MKRAVVAGASGFVGQRVMCALRDAGWEAVGGSRNPDRAAQNDPASSWVRFDVGDENSMRAALDGADTLIYLVHEMGSGADDLVAKERASAERVLRCVEAAGLRRVVYLGGPKPSGAVSTHLEARLVTGEVLRSGSVSTIELQAGMIMGAGSESWLIVRDLALRLPVMVLPSWLSRLSEPIAIRDVAAALVAAASLDVKESLCLGLPGPECVSARNLLERVGRQVGVRHLMIPVPVLTPALSSHWIRLVSRADFKVARKLVDGLTCDLISRPETLWQHAPELHITPLDEAIRAALEEEPLDSMPRRQRLWERSVRALSLNPR